MGMYVQRWKVDWWLSAAGEGEPELFSGHKFSVQSRRRKGSEDRV
jgi:hypothetical protein